MVRLPPLCWLIVTYSHSVFVGSLQPWTSFPSHFLSSLSLLSGPSSVHIHSVWWGFGLVPYSFLFLVSLSGHGLRCFWFFTIVLSAVLRGLQLWGASRFFLLVHLSVSLANVSFPKMIFVHVCCMICRLSSGEVFLYKLTVLGIGAAIFQLPFINLHRFTLGSVRSSWLSLLFWHASG